MNQHKMAVIKEEIDDNLITPLEGWNAVTGDTISPFANSTPSLSTTTTQSVSNQPSPLATTSNHPSTSTSRSSHVNTTYPNVASVRANPPNARQGLVKIVERNDNNWPFIAARTNKFVPIGSNVQQTNAALPFEFLLKQTQDQMKELTTKLADHRNVYSLLEKKYDDLKLENEKQHHEIKQLKNVLQWYHQVTIMTQNNAQTPPETSHSTAQLYEETVDDISTRPDLLNNLLQVEQNIDSQHCPSLSNGIEMLINQELSNDDSVSNLAIDILSSNQLNSNNNSVSQCIETANEDVSPSANEQIAVFNKLTHESGHHEVIGANVDQQSTQMFQSNDAQAKMNEVLNGENGLIDLNEQNTDSNDEEDMSNNEHSVSDSNEPFTCAQLQTNQMASTQPITGSYGQNSTKCKQSQSNCSVKRSKKVVEDEEEKDGKQQQEEGQQAAQMVAQPIEANNHDITLNLRCLQAECGQVFVHNETNQAVDQHNHHLLTEHCIDFYRCALEHCGQSFNVMTHN